MGRQVLEDVICRISALVEVVPETAELDLNPIKLLAAGEGVLVVDAQIRVRKSQPWTETASVDRSP